MWTRSKKESQIDEGHWSTEQRLSALVFWLLWVIYVCIAGLLVAAIPVLLPLVVALGGHTGTPVRASLLPRPQAIPPVLVRSAAQVRPSPAAFPAFG